MFLYIITAIVWLASVVVFAIHEMRAHGGLTYYSGLNLGAIALIVCSLILYHWNKNKLLFSYKRKMDNALDSLQEQKETLGTLMDNLPCALSAISPTYKVLHINKRIEELTGVKSEEVIGKKCFQIFGRGEVCNNCPVEKALESKQVHQNIKRELTVQDREIYIEQTAIPIIERNGKVKYVLEIILDATAKVLLEKANHEQFLQTVSALAVLINKRDTATGKHSARVKEIALAIGRKLEFAEDILEEIAIAALLHDIGKIGIPESILNKPGKLSEEERLIVQQHSEIGHNSLKEVKSLSKIAEYILYHHERYDGQGYPSKIQGDQIPLISRVLCVADVFEAITADRVYRPAMSLDEALVVMTNGKGTIFDPQILEALLSYLSTEKDEQPKNRLEDG